MLNSIVPELPLLERGKVRHTYDLDDVLLIVADTKFEFGVCQDELILMDEVLTSDSSRFWPADGYAPGKPQPRFDTQYARDHLAGLRWGKRPPAPPLPPGIVRKTSEKYPEALQRITGSLLPFAPTRDAADDALAGWPTRWTRANRSRLKRPEKGGAASPARTPTMRRDANSRPSHCAPRSARLPTRRGPCSRVTWANSSQGRLGKCPPVAAAPPRAIAPGSDAVSPE